MTKIFSTIGFAKPFLLAGSFTGLVAIFLATVTLGLVISRIWGK